MRISQESWGESQPRSIRWDLVSRLLVVCLLPLLIISVNNRLAVADVSTRTSLAEMIRLLRSTGLNARTRLSFTGIWIHWIFKIKLFKIVLNTANRYTVICNSKTFKFSMENYRHLNCYNLTRHLPWHIPNIYFNPLAMTSDYIRSLQNATDIRQVIIASFARFASLVLIFHFSFDISLKTQWSNSGFN